MTRPFVTVLFDGRAFRRRVYDPQKEQRERYSIKTYGPEWGPVHRAALDLQRAIKAKEPTHE